jgi:hypothetical protein
MAVHTKIIESQHNSPRPAADVLVVGPGGSYNDNLRLLAVFVEFFRGIDRRVPPQIGSYRDRALRHRT